MAMIKHVTFFKRRKDLSIAEFGDHWRGQHAELVKQLPGVIRYTQNHAQPGVFEPSFDGVAEVWFEDLAAMRAHSESDELAAVLADEANFMDPDSRGSILTDEYVFLDRRADSATRDDSSVIKLIGFVRRAPESEPEAFFNEYRDELGSMLEHVPGLLRYSQSHCRLGFYRSGRVPPFDAAGMLWFPDQDTFNAALASPELRAIGQRELVLFDSAQTALLLAQEHEVIGANA